jgi:murein L,D-transpeptidase YafK
MRFLLVFLLFFFVVYCNAKLTITSTKSKVNSIDSIVVYKAKRVLIIYSKKLAVKSYSVSIGENPLGHKIQQGDNKTPEGIYYINDKNAKSSYYRNLGISYPNKSDNAKAAKLKVATGGDIKIHGYADEKGSFKNRGIKYAYTWGCIALTNADMDELFSWVKKGAVINILP